MFIFLSKFLPNLFYPLGLAGLFILLALLIQKKRGWQRAFLLSALALVWLGGNRWVAFGMARSLEWRYLPKGEISQADAIVVLGGGTEAATYPRPQVEMNGAGDRILYAASLYKQGYAPHLLLSGGSLSLLETRNSTPAVEMASILEMMGIPSGEIWLEDASQNTYENALFTHQILAGKGIQRIILVTSAMHMPRAMLLFEKQGFEVIPAPCDYTVTETDWDSLMSFRMPESLLYIFPNSSSLSLTTNVLKEYFGLLVYRLRGWI
jgi:uncharacterized SAM-binding protein YcdF (DUF218 family)